jgi:glucosamine-6-phosphate deaminase
MGKAAAEHGAECIQSAVDARGEAAVILATGASQFTMLERLVELDLDWSRVRCFHLDEYVGLDEQHPASFHRYLRERFLDRITGAQPRSFEFVNGNADDLAAECRRLSSLISAATVDASFVGIGENGHLAFNNPPADFETRVPFFVVELDEECRRQQIGEGWFASLEDVPNRAITMSCREILRSRHIIASVPQRRKSHAVSCTVNGPVSPDCPASILQEHPDCWLFLDKTAASELSKT